MEKNLILVGTTKQFIGEYLEEIILDERIGDSVRIVYDGAEILQLAVEEKPVCMALCFFMPTLGGISILRHLREMGIHIPALCFCGNLKSHNGVIALKDGARGVIDLTRGRFEFGEALRKVRDGGLYVPEDVQNLLDSREYEYYPERFRDMSLREEEVLHMVARGQSNQEVAYILNISQKTVEKHKKSIRDKLGLSSSYEICTFAIQEGLVDIKEGERLFVQCNGKEIRQVAGAGGGLRKFLDENALLNSRGETRDEVKVFLGGLFFKESKQDGRFPWVFSTFDMDWDEERIDPAGWKLENYRKNPVVLWAHDSRIPAIGYSEEVAVSDGTLGGSVCFNEQSIDPFGWGIGQRVRTGVIRAGSVGFLIEKVEVSESDGVSSLVFRQQELLEFSICNVPSNPFAMVEIRESSEGELTRKVMENGRDLIHSDMKRERFWRGVIGC